MRRPFGPDSHAVGGTIQLKFIEQQDPVMVARLRDGYYPRIRNYGMPLSFMVEYAQSMMHSSHHWTTEMVGIAFSVSTEDVESVAFEAEIIPLTIAESRRWCVDLFKAPKMIARTPTKC